ncbi:MAG: hypothetical protein HF978_03185 [Desulfobacteraceae bacterium]|nr:hypothetical protein [Desulfobacteraceae bacterium]MBC2754529.1 hypothetical protein [Desulfobacteraceae bacterium]MBC2763806.1 hypothetical protein [ANME-2 cluster archaeon]
MQTTDARIKKRAWTSLPFWTAAFFSALVFLIASPGIRAGCIDLADEPLEIQSMGAPGMIMFVYDNSGSMGWSMMTNEDEGQFHYGGVTYSYLFDGESPNNSGELFNANPQEYRMLWESQWSGYNKVYYNPGVIYEPWPGWTEVADVAHAIPAAAPQADTDNPLLYVVRDNHGYTFNLNDIWYTIEIGGGFDVDDLINTQGTIVDNTDTSPVRELVVDDGDPGFSVTGNAGDWNYFPAEPAYYGFDYMNYYGSTDPLPVTATWTFYNVAAAEYEVMASIPKHSTRIQNADYTITHQYGTTTQTISQYNRTGELQEWVSLGTYDFDGDSTVELDFTVIEKKGRESVGVDAIKLIPTSIPGNPVAVFESTGPWGVSISPTYQYGVDYLWTQYAADNYTARWTATNLDPGLRYSAYVRWVANAFRSNDVHYRVDGNTISMDQMHNSGVWTLLDDNIAFGTTGVVELEHYCDSLDNDRACADAVAFAPTPASAGTPLDIIMAHYFVQNANGTFLVNLDGAIKYYRVVSPDDTIVENGELFEMTVDEARAAGIYTSRSYTQERQNFANWFQFSRTRDHVGRFAVAKLVQAMGNIYFGLMTVPPRDVYAIRAVREAMVINRDDTLEIYNNIYNLPDPSSSTPLKDSFLQVAEFFEGAASLVNAHDKAYFIDGGYADVDTYPYLNEANGGNCQQAFLIAMTDGLYNSNNSSSIPNHDGDNNTDWDGGEFADNYINTLADISMDFYERDLKDMLSDDVPINEWDKNTQQHLVTYALSFGIKGNIDPVDWPDCPPGVDCPDWPLPVEGELTTIDDMYHATVNGRGMFLNANNPRELVEALMKIKQNIEERLGSSAAVTTSSVQRQIGSKLYRGEYMTGKWTGDLKAFEIDVETGAVFDDYSWSVKEQMDLVTDYTNRKIYSYNGISGIPFDFNSMTSDQKTRLADGLAYAFGTAVAYTFGTIDNTDVENLVNYLSGDESNDRAHGGPFRVRAHILGDIVHSEAEYNTRTLYVAANDGMLHAFHSETGREVGAYVPNMLYNELGKLSYPNYQHQYFINNTPYVADTGTKKLLVCPMAKGYKGLFALDVTIPIGQADASKVALWEYPGAGASDPDLGYTYSQATIFKTEAAGWVVITGNGYDSDNGHAILYVFDALTGTVVKKFDTGVGGCNGLSSPAIVDPDSNGKIDFIYAGDLKGNMWKFDLRGATVADWKIAYNDGSDPQPLITVTDPDGNPQAITTSPGVMFVNQCNPPGSDGYLVLFGTGKYLGLTDTTDGSQHSVYGVYDWGPDWEAETGSAEDKYLGTLSVGSPRTLANAGAAAGKELSLVQQSIINETNRNGETYRFVTNNEVSYYNMETNDGSALGWYIDLPDYGERMVRRPIVRGNVFTFVANIPEKSPCTAGGRSVLYQLDACSGGWPEEPQFDVDGDGDFDEDDLFDLDVDGDGDVDMDDLLAIAYDFDEDGDVDMADVLAIFDKNDDGVIDGDDLDIGVPPIGQEFDSLLLDPTLLEDVIYLNDLDDVEGHTIPELPTGAWFWQVIE